MMLAIVVIGAVYVVKWYAYSTYYIGNDAGVIAVYQGQPNGVLWFKPKKVFDTDYPSSQLLPSDERALSSTISAPTLNFALKYATHIRNLWRVHQHELKVASTTTTTLAGSSTTTTVKKAAG
jgi:hypothetical protein